MRICIVTEFGQDNYFQWRNVWDLDRQTKMNVFVDSLTICPNILSIHDDDSKYFDKIRKADLVISYASRTHPPNTPYNRHGIVYLWNWWELPKIIKKYMRPEAKMIAQNDDDWIWLEHPEWVWWSDVPDTHGGMENFFKETGILEVADMYWTVLDNPNWTKFTSKPTKYMPLPHLWRYSDSISKSNSMYQTKGVPFMHDNNIALIKHTSIPASIDSTMHNVIEKIGLPVRYFATQWGQASMPKYDIPVKVYSYLNVEQYMDILRNDCLIAIDDAENYVGWSRFVMECAINYVPCIGSNFANKLFFPDLYIKHNDFAKQNKLIKQLINDNAYYKKVVDEGYQIMANHLNPDRLCNEVLRIAKDELNVQESPIDLELELLKTILKKLLPFSLIPPRPSLDQNIFDDYHHRVCDQAQWDVWYGRYKRFIYNDTLYNNLIREVLNER
jgi:hypothetical protein